MAVNIPIRLTTQAQGCFADGREWTYDVRIHDAEWAGVVSDFSLYESGVKIEWTGNEEDIFFPVLPSTVTLQIWVDGPIIQQFVEDLQLVQENRFYISILKNGVEVYWRGTVLQDQTRTEDNRGCEAFTCKVVAACGLSRLKDVSYDVPYIFDYYNHMAYIVQLLNKVVPPGLFEVTDDYVGSNVTFYDEQMPPTDGLLITEPLVYVKTEREGLLLTTDDDGNVTNLNSFDAVSRILRSYNARIFMFNGIFFITQVRDLADSVLFNFYNNGYSAPPTPNMTPFAAGANALNVDYAIRQPLDYPIESNEYAYYPEVKAVRVLYNVDVSSALIKVLNGLEATEYRSRYQIPLGYPSYYAFNVFGTKTYNAQQPLYFLDVDITIRAVVGGVNYYAQPSGGVLIWSTTVSTINAYFQGQVQNAFDTGFIGSRSYSLPALVGSTFIYVSWTATAQNVTVDSYNFEGNTIPKLNELAYQSENIDSESTIIQEVDGPLLNDGELFMAPDSQVWNGTAWVNLTDWAEGAPPAPGTGEPYPAFLARQMLELQDSPRAKYYGSFWDDIAPINLFYYDTKKYVLTKATLLIGESQWDVTMVEIDQVPATIANDGPGNGGTPPTLSIQPPINPTDGPLTWNINANLNGSVLYPGANYVSEEDAVGESVPVRTVQESKGWLMISNKETTEPAAPVLDGEPFVLIGDNWTPEIQTENAEIQSGHTYFFDTAKFIKEILVYVPNVAYTYLLRVAIYKDPGNIKYEEFAVPTLTANFWTLAKLGNSLIEPQSYLTILLKVTNPGNTNFSFDPNYWVNFPPPVGITVTPELFLNGVNQNPEPNTAYGVDVKLQEVTSSPDWNFLAYTPLLLTDDVTGQLAVRALLEESNSRYIFNAPGVPITSNWITYQTIIADTTNYLIRGSYLLQFTISTSHNKANLVGYYRLLVNGLPVSEWAHEVKDINDVLLQSENSLILEQPTGGTFLIELQTRSADIQIDIQVNTFRYNLTYWN